MGEEQYYENQDLWASNRGWEDPAEQMRFSETNRLIPQDVVTLMDLGCGNGMFLKHLGQARPAIKRSGLERSRAALSVAEAVSGCPVTQGNAETTPFENNSFDCVTAMEILEHLPESSYTKVLDELERVAKDHILISIPYDEILIRIECPECGCRFNPNYHLRRFDEANLRTLFKNFSLSDSTFVWEEKRPLLYGALHRIYSRLFNPFPPLAQCPECGFKKKATAPSSRHKLGQSPKAFLRRILPGETRHRWIVCRYGRNRP